MRLASSSWALLLFTTATVACGGQTSDDLGQTGPGTGGSSAGGSSAGGSSSSTGGSSAKGGSSVAGAGGSVSTQGVGGDAGAGPEGGSSAVGGSSSTGGSSTGSCCTGDSACAGGGECVANVCKPPLPVGQCWRDADCASGSCFGASVCPCGTDCKKPDAIGTCGSPATWSTCNKPGDCLLELNSCCGSCGKLTKADEDAVNFQQIDAHHTDVCPAQMPCPGCAEMPDYDLAAFCRQNTCSVIEVSKDDVSACNTDADCEMHLSACCDCGTQPIEQYVALNNGQIGAYESQVCGPGVGGCPSDCVGLHPPGYGVACSPAKHCEIVPLTGGPSCPANAPVGGSACKGPSGTICEYGNQPVVACREHAQCVSGTWQYAGTACPPVSGPGQNGCLKTTNEVGLACGNPGQLCDLGGGEICECNACFGGPCMPEAHWACSTPGAPQCPLIAPDTGQPCNDEGAACSYGVTCGETGTLRTCTGGVWVDQSLVCAGLSSTAPLVTVRSRFEQSSFREVIVSSNRPFRAISSSTRFPSCERITP